MRTLAVLSAALVTLSMAGCKPSSVPPPAQGAAQQVPTPVETAPAGPFQILRVDPTEMSACEKKARVATLTWDASSVPDDLGLMEFWVTYPGVPPKLFARGPAKKGSIKTGMWTQAGASFALKKADGTEIAHADVGSVPCQ